MPSSSLPSNMEQLYQFLKAVTSKKYQTTDQSRILHFASKVIEKVIALQLKRFLDKHVVLDEHQSAYRNYHSTETAILDITSNLVWGLNNESTFLVISLDLSAAFDTVNYEILLSILFQIGNFGQAHSVIKSYLNGRIQCVHIDGSYSEDKSIETGIPQGSILGPVLFILYLLPLRSLPNEFVTSYHICANVCNDLLAIWPGYNLCQFPGT